MARVFAVVLLSLLTAPALARAQSPCDAAPTTLVVAPTKLVAELPQHATLALDGVRPLVAEYVAEIRAEGAAAAVTTHVLPRAAWTLIAGTTACYETTFPSVPIAAGIRYVATLTARGADGLDSQPSDASNPFGWPARPTVGRVRLVR